MQNLFDLQAAFFARVNACDARALAMSGVCNMGISYTPLRTAPEDLENIRRFAFGAPVPLIWVDLANVNETYKSLVLPVNPPFYHALRREIFMLSPTYFETDAYCKHALLHESAHHIHFKEHGYNTSTHPCERTGRGTQYSPQQAYNIGEMVAETAATLAALALGILTTEQTQGCAEYVAMYRMGGMVPTNLPATEGWFIIPIAERLISLYGDNV
jgi:hypothetical protein